MQCKLCRREAERDDELCRYHSAARAELKKSYQVWKQAYSGVSWREYLNRVKTLDDTGQWIKEVITLEEASSAV
jgi:DNA topoisomerase I